LTPEDFRTLYEYNAWANRRVLDACAALPPEQFNRPLGSSFPSIRDTLAHITVAEWIWTERWRGESPTAPPEWMKSADGKDLDERLSALDRSLVEYVSRLSADDLARPIAYRNLSGESSSQPAWQPLQHLANHSTYHRGQIVTMLRQVGAKAPHTDMIVFYRERAK
jgi:uncharacterized damage-inducible protein DinB